MTLPARRRLCAPAGADVLTWLQSRARRGDTVLLDLQESPLPLPKVRGVGRWAATRPDVTVLVMGRLWHRAALSMLRRQDVPPHGDRALYSNQPAGTPQMPPGPDRP